MKYQIWKRIQFHLSEGCKLCLRSFQEESWDFKCCWMLQMPTPLISCDSGAGGCPRCYDRGVSGGPPEPQLERPEGCALPEGEDIRHQQVYMYGFYFIGTNTHTPTSRHPWFIQGLLLVREKTTKSWNILTFYSLMWRSEQTLHMAKVQFYFHYHWMNNLRFWGDFIIKFQYL